MAITERNLQKEAVRWLRKTYPALLFYYVPNERRLKTEYRSSLRAMGLLPGVSDLVIVKACHGYHGFFSEVKNPNSHRKQSAEQVIFQRRVEHEGYFYHWWDDLEQFQSQVQTYLNSTTPHPH